MNGQRRINTMTLSNGPTGGGRDKRVSEADQISFPNLYVQH